MLLLVTVFAISNVNGQDLPKSGDNYLNSSLNKFVGLWIWVNNSDTVWLKTSKENLKFPGEIRADVLIGRFKQLKGKTVVRDGFKSHYKATDKSTGFFAGMNQSGSKVTGSLGDYEANKFYKIDLILAENGK